jgi:hypothetical protein
LVLEGVYAYSGCKNPDRKGKVLTYKPEWDKDTVGKKIYNACWQRLRSQEKRANTLKDKERRKNHVLIRGAKIPIPTVQRFILTSQNGIKILPLSRIRIRTVPGGHPTYQA